MKSKSLTGIYLGLFWMAFIILNFWFTSVYAQQGTMPSADSIVSKMELYNATKSPSALFLHFDKTIYTNNENVWFTAYLVNCKDILLHYTLSVALVKDDDHKIAMQGLFVMGQGVAFGNFFLPDTIAPGNYSFVAFTNRVTSGKPDVLFIQQVTIKTLAEESFNISLAMADTADNLSTGKKVRLFVRDKHNVPLIGAQIEYSEKSNKNSTTIKRITDITGQSELAVAPEIQSVEARVKYNKVVKDVKLILPASQQLPTVKFYPESGNLIDAIPATIGWEIKSGAGNPMQCSGILYKNDSVIDTIYTDASGMGHFRILPRAGVSYSVKLTNKTTADRYFLPQAAKAGASITIMKGLATDTLHIQLRSVKQGTVYLVIHNYKQVFYTLPVKVLAGSSRSVKIDLSIVPRGIAEVTLLDSLQRPLAERLFFAKYDQKTGLKITTDKEEYTTRQKVSVRLKLNPQGNKPGRGVISVACVQSNRIDPKKINNIESYLYLQNELATADADPSRMEINKANEAYMENVLLIKGWRRYNWQEMMRRNDTAQTHDAMLFNGSITSSGKPVKKAQYIGITHDSTTSIIQTDTKGNFSLSRDNLVTAEDKKISLFVNSKTNYSIKVDNPYSLLNTSLTTQLNLEPVHLMGAEQNTGLYIMKDLEHAIHLKEVTIRQSNKNSTFFAGSNYISTNSCNDYVCMYNILNCKNHLAGMPPQDGGTYIFEGRSVVYHGVCNPAPSVNNALSNISGIAISKEFYADDYAKFNPPDPEYLSTIYWKRLLEVNSLKETEFSFYTSDITGDFKIVVQGVTADNVIYITKSFTVKK